MRRTLVLLGTLLALAQPAQAADLTIGVSAEVTSLDPHLLPAQPNINVAWHVFDALVHVDAKMRVVPGLAESWRAIDDTTWEIRLREGVRFHDGSELTADDVVFSLQRPRSPRLAQGGYASIVRPIVEMQAVDRRTVRLKTAVPYGVLPQELNSIFIVSRKAAQDAGPEDFDAGRAMVGTGPYRFVGWRRGDRVVLERFDGWWGGRTPWARVTLRQMTADPVRTAALLAGDVDAIEHVPTADLPRLAASPRIALERTVSWRTVFLHADQRPEAAVATAADGSALGRNPLADARVRRALSMAIDRRAIVGRVMQALAVPASNLVSPPVFGHNAAIPVQQADPDGARRLLAEAGYPHGFALTLGTPNNRYMNDEQVAQAVAQMLARIGVRVRVQALPFSVYLPKARAREYGLSLLGWGSFAQDLALRALVATNDPARGYGAWNWSGYSNPSVDGLVGQALGSVDAKQREARAREAAAVAMGEVAVLPLHHQVVTWAMRKGLAYEARTDEFTFAHRFRAVP